MIALAVALAVGLAGVLSGFKFAGLLGQAVTSRMEVMTGTVTDEAELGLTLGLPLADLADLQALVERQAAGDARVVTLAIFDDGGRILFSMPREAVGTPAPGPWRTAWRMAERNAGGGPWTAAVDDRTLVGTVLHGPYGEVVGGVALGYASAGLAQELRTVITGLIPVWLALILGAALAALAAAILTIRLMVAGAGPSAALVRPLGLRLAGVTLAVLLLASALTAWQALAAFEPVILPEVTLKAAALGRTLTGELERALHYRIPIDRLPGVDALFETTLKGNPDIAYLALADRSGRRLAAAGVGAPVDLAGPPTDRRPDHLVTQLPVSDGDEVQGRLEIGVERSVVARVSHDLILDIGSVLLASVLIAFELVLVVASRAASATGSAVATVLGPAAGAAGSGAGPPADPNPADPNPVAPTPVDLTLVRLPLFLFCLSEEVSRPFFPSFARSFADGVPWLSPDLVVSLPITVFMLVWALSQPLGALWSDRVGRRRAIMIGAGLAACGLALTALTATLYDLLLWRTITALGYGLVLISAQGAVIDHTSPGTRASGMAMVIGGLLAAGVCGPLIGGVIADQIGFRPTFLVGAGLALTAALVVALALPADSAARTGAAGAAAAGAAAAAAGISAAGAPPPTMSWRVLIRLCRNPRFLALALFSAIPTKIAATALLFYLLPLFLGTLGASKADIGRIQMLYFLAFILISPLAAWLADRLAAGRELVALGGFATILAVLPLLLSDSLWASAIAIALFGVFQALIGAPQLALVSLIATLGGNRADEAPALGVFRLIERIGASAGPLIAVTLAITFSYREAIIAIGLFCGVSALVFLLSFRSRPAGHSG